MQRLKWPPSPDIVTTSRGVTFADLRRLIARDAGRSERQKRDDVSAISCLAELFETPPEQLPASRQELERRAKQVVPARFGISRKTFQNYLSRVRKALERHGIETPRTPLTKRSVAPEWEALLQQVPHEMDAWCLRQLGAAATLRGLGPTAIDDAAFAALTEDIVAMQGKQAPHFQLRRIVNTWNRISRQVPGWPQQQLMQLPSRRRGWTQPLEAYPARFRQEVESCLARLGSRDPFDADAPPRPLRPKTVAHRRHQLRELAGALVQSGVAIESIIGLAVLFEPGNFRAALRWIVHHRWQRQGIDPETPNTRAPESVYRLAINMVSIARHRLRLHEPQLAELAAICQRIHHRPRGLRPKNRQILMQFEDRLNVYKLICLPEDLLREARGKRNRNVRSARLVRDAVLIELLLMVAPRIGALLQARLDDLLWSQGRRKGSLHLRLREETGKTDVPIERELPQDSAELIRAYLEIWRPFLPHADGPWLFPGRFGSHLGPGASTHLSKLIRDRTGLKMTAHAFRHVIAKLHLDRHPGEYETIRLTLGHRSSDTTLENYVGLESAAAGRHVDETILSVRRQGRRGRHPSQEPHFNRGGRNARKRRGVRREVSS